MQGASEWGFWKQGSGVRIYPAAKILNPERVVVGSNIIIDDFVFIGSHKKLIIGNYVHIANHASITGGGECLLCDFAGISSGTRVLTGSDDFLGGGLTGPPIPAPYRAVSRSRVVIEAYAVIGANCVVLPGVTIGEGATVGAGSVIRKSLKPWGVYVGQPLRWLRARPKEKLVELTQRLFDDCGLPEHRYLDKALLDS